jgi:hypothetical protein
VGFIASFENAENGVSPNIDRRKFRTYNLGLPVGFKIGKLHQSKPFFLFAGYELEVAMQYKQKEFDGSDKVNKTTAWFSDRTEIFQQSLYGGIQFPGGYAVKFKYYLTEFFDDSYTQQQTVNGITQTVRPFENFNANVFYFSLEWYPFRSLKSVYSSGVPGSPSGAQARR